MLFLMAYVTTHTNVVIFHVFLPVIETPFLAPQFSK